MGEQKLYEFDKERNQYRKRYGKAVDTKTEADGGSSIYARAAEKSQTSYRRVEKGINPIEAKKRLKRIFWIVFVIIAIVWGVFVLKYMPESARDKSSEPPDNINQLLNP